MRPDPYIFRKKREDSPARHPYNTDPRYNSVYNTNNPKDVAGRYFDNVPYNDFNSNDLPRLFDSLDSPRRNRSPYNPANYPRGRSFSPAEQLMDDDYLQPDFNFEFYGENPANDFIGIRGNKDEIKGNAANYDTNELLLDPVKDKFDNEDDDDDYIKRMSKNLKKDPPPEPPKEESESVEIIEEEESEQSIVQEPEILYPDGKFKYVEIPIAAPETEKMDMNVSCTSLMPVSPPEEEKEVPPKPDMHNVEIDATIKGPEMVHNNEGCTDKAELKDISLECDLEPIMFDAEISTDVREKRETEMMTEEEKKEYTEMGVETDKAEMNDDIGKGMNTDAEVIKERTEFLVLTDEIKPVERKEFVLNTDPIKKIEKDAEIGKMNTDPI